MTGATGLVAAIALAGCGSSTPSQSADDASLTATSAPTPVSTAPAPITASEATAFARSKISEVKSDLRPQVSKVGKAKVECVAAADSQYECLYQVSFRKLDRCGILKVTVYVEQSADGPKNVNQSQETEGQICYIGANGEPVPDNPNR